MTNRPDRGALEAARYGLPRSPHWAHVRAEHLKLSPLCAVSGLAEGDQGTKLEVHHIWDFHECVLAGRPDLELDLRNLLTIAREGPLGDPHLIVGHLDSFESMNPDAVADAALFHGMTEAAIRADPRWLAKMAARPRPWREQSDAEHRAFRETLDRLFPRAVVVPPSP